MSKELEALDNLLKQELIRPNKYRKTIGDIASVGQIAIIQKALQRLEKIDKIIIKYENRIKHSLSDMSDPLRADGFIEIIEVQNNE